MRKQEPQRLNRLLTPFFASPAAIVNAYQENMPWINYWQRSAVWVRTHEEALALQQETEKLEEERQSAFDEFSAISNLPVLDRRAEDVVRERTDDPDFSKVWDTINGHCYDNPTDVFADWWPLALVSYRVVVIDKYAVSLEKPAAGEENNDETFAQMGLRAFAEFLEQVAVAREQTIELHFVTSEKTLKQAPKKNQKAASDDARVRLNGWKGESSPNVKLEARTLNDSVGEMHDRYFIFQSESSVWHFAVGRGISAFANAVSPLSVALVASVPDKWLNYNQA